MKNRINLLGALAILLFSGLVNAQVPGKIPNRNGQTYADNAYLRFGNSEDALCGYNTFQSPDALICGTSVDSNNFLITEKGDVGFDFAHALSTNPTLFVHSHNQSTSQWISLSHNGTNGVIDVGTGIVTFPGGISGALSPTGMSTYSSGLAVTAGSYQVGRDADGTNQLHFNVPTGASFEFSVNDVAKAVIDTTQADFKALNLVTTGTFGAGAATFTALSTSAVTKFQLTQADLTSTCTLGDLKLDTGGSTKELCYCSATDTWLCTAMTAGPVD